MGHGRKKKVQLSKMYSFRRERFEEDHSQIGGPGFSRVIYCNENGESESMIQNYADNYVRLTKYTPVTFLPKSLFEQFRRVDNFYFLVAGLLAFTPLAPYSVKIDFILHLRKSIYVKIDFIHIQQDTDETRSSSVA